MRLPSRTAADRDRRDGPHRAVLVTGALTLIACYFGYLWLANALIKHRHGPEHVYDRRPATTAATRPFLTDAEALAHAQEALRRDGLDPARWRPRPDDRAKAPDGTPERYFVRNDLNPNAGWILFVDSTHDWEKPTTRRTNPQRIVHVDLVAGDKVKCQVILPK